MGANDEPSVCDVVDFKQPRSTLFPTSSYAMISPCLTWGSLMTRRLTRSLDCRPDFAYPDSQFSALSTEVLRQLNWRHYRSGSPITPEEKFVRECMWYI